MTQVKPVNSNTQTSLMYGRAEEGPFRSADILAEDLSDILANLRKHGTPDLVLTVEGAVRDNEIRPRFKKQLRRGIMNIANLSVLWVVTHSKDNQDEPQQNNHNISGIAKLVTDIVSDYTLAFGDHSRIVVFHVADRPCEHVQKVKDDSTNNKVRLSSKEKETQTDNVAQFYTIYSKRGLIPNECTYPVGSIIEQITNGVPLACVVFGGDFETLQAIQYFLESQQPVIVVDGSGGVADIIAYAYNNSTEVKPQQTHQHKKLHRYHSIIGVELGQEIKQVLESKFPRNKDTCQELVTAILNKRGFIKVSKQDQREHIHTLDNTILQTILEGFVAVININNMKHFKRLKSRLRNNIEMLLYKIIT